MCDQRPSPRRCQRSAAKAAPLTTRSGSRKRGGRELLDLGPERVRLHHWELPAAASGRQRAAACGREGGIPPRIAWADGKYGGAAAAGWAVPPVRARPGRKLARKKDSARRQWAWPTADRGTAVWGRVEGMQVCGARRRVVDVRAEAISVCLAHPVSSVRVHACPRTPHPRQCS
jgi:hypothetical protein